MKKIFITLAIILLLFSNIGVAKATPIYVVPASIVHDCSTTVEVQLMNFFATVPNNSTIQFQPNSCYGIVVLSLAKTQLDVVK